MTYTTKTELSDFQTRAWTRPKAMVVTTCALLLALSGCITMDDKFNPGYSDYTSVHVIGEEALHAEMGAMSQELLTLLQLNASTDRPEPQSQQLALDTLNKIKSIASSIGGDNVITNYSVINRYMGAFLYDVGVAQDFVEKQPPNYFPAASLIKSCMSCHDSF